MDKAKFYTPHIKATPDDFAKTVLMPGDPLRAKFIVDNFIDNAILINPVRGINGYTGYYKGERVPVMASGMGMPSMGIYSYELFNFFGVENIMRAITLEIFSPPTFSTTQIRRQTRAGSRWACSVLRWRRRRSI